jgi:hypothetical protein
MFTVITENYQVLAELDWHDEVQQARFITRFSKVCNRYITSMLLSKFTSRSTCPWSSIAMLLNTKKILKPMHGDSPFL